MRVFLSSLLAGIVMAAVACGADAQAVDHAALADIFGEPVTTSVTGSPQRASELPASAVIITREEIARASAKDVPDLLKSLAGVDVNRWTASQTDISIRGGVQTYNARLLVLVDGRQVYLDHYGLTNWNLLGVDLDGIQQIELIRGPAAALFGFNAASGVVNIITRQPSGKTEAHVSGSFGNKHQARATGTLLFPVVGAISAKISGGTSREDERERPAGLLGSDTTGDATSSHASATLFGSFGATQMQLDGGLAKSRQLELLPSEFLSTQDYLTHHIRASVTRDTDWGGLSAATYVNWLHIDYDVGAPTQTSSYNGLHGTSAANRIIVGQVSALLRIDSVNSLRAEFEYRNNRLRSTQQFSDLVSYDFGSVNLIADLHLTPAIGVTVAGRLDRLWLGQSGAIAIPVIYDPAEFDRTLTRFSFNAAVLIETSPDGRLHINGGRGYQLPSLINFGLRLRTPLPTSFPYFIVGSPETDPVAVWSAEIGYDHRLGDVHLDGTIFYNKTIGAIGTPGTGLVPEIRFVPTPVLLGEFKAIGNFSAFGVELSASGRTAGITWRTNATWTHVDENLAGVSAPITYALSPRSTTPRFKANLELGYDGGEWSLSVVARYTSATRQFAFANFPYLILYPVDAAIAFDLKGTYRISRTIDLFAAGENLSKAGGAALSPIPADRRIRVGLDLQL